MTIRPVAHDRLYFGVGLLLLTLTATEYFFDTPLDPAGKTMVEGIFAAYTEGHNFFALIFLLISAVCISVPVMRWTHPLDYANDSNTIRFLVVARRWLVGCFVFISLFLGLYEVSQEILLRVYMYGSIGLERADLSEDYGLGMLLLFSSLVYAVIAFPTLLCFVCKFFKNR